MNIDLNKVEFGGDMVIPDVDMQSTAKVLVPSEVKISAKLLEYPEGYKQKAKVVPLAKNHYFKEDDIRTFAVGSPDYLKNVANRFKNRPAKISTGIPELDEICGGGWATGLNVVAAAPGTGKTTILLQSACAMAQRGQAVVYITNDMRELDLTAKVFCSSSYQLAGEKCLRLGDILNKNVLNSDTDHVREVFKAVEKTLPYLHIRDLIADDNFDQACANEVTLSEMSKMERIFDVFCNTYENVVFIADSLQQIAGYIGGGKEGVDTQLREFKRLSRKYSAPVIMISTLNRTGYSKMGEIEFSDLKESGSIEYDADILVTMVAECMVSENPTTDMKGFKMSDYRHIRLTCKKSRDSGERDKTMTLYAPGCTFIPQVKDKQGAFTATGRYKNTGKRSGQPLLPSPGSIEWRGIGG